MKISQDECELCGMLRSEADERLLDFGMLIQDDNMIICEECINNREVIKNE